MQPFSFPQERRAEWKLSRRLVDMRSTPPQSLQREGLFLAFKFIPDLCEPSQYSTWKIGAMFAKTRMQSVKCFLNQHYSECTCGAALFGEKVFNEKKALLRNSLICIKSKERYLQSPVWHEGCGSKAAAKTRTGNTLHSWKLMWNQKPIGPKLGERKSSTRHRPGNWKPELDAGYWSFLG